MFFVVYRKDRNNTVSSEKDGDGVMIAARNKLYSFHQEQCSCDRIVEDIWVTISISGHNFLHICCVMYHLMLLLII